jgi:hypothetical protein
MLIYGVDFTSAPKRDKPIVVAECEAHAAGLAVKGFHEFADWPAYEMWLETDGEWIGGFDFPFGLPRRFVEAQRWPSDWAGMVEACVASGKERFAETAMRAFVAARSLEDKHRETDLVAKSHSPLKTRTNPPVGLMFYEGTWRLLKRGIRIPGLNETASRKLALEAYPGFLVRQLRERYYKNDKLGAGTANRDARKRIVEALAAGSVSCPVSLGSKSLRERLLHASGDWLDAVLCATQAHWAWQKRDRNFGLPARIDPREGWIVSA